MALVIEMEKDEHKAFKKELNAYGAIARVMEATSLPRGTIENVRDKGRALEETIEKIRGYRAARQNGKGQKEALSAA